MPAVPANPTSYVWTQYRKDHGEDFGRGDREGLTDERFRLSALAARVGCSDGDGVLASTRDDSVISVELARVGRQSSLLLTPKAP